MAHTVCGRCHEPVRFVDGVRGPDRWRHTRTDAVACSPLCWQCGAPATEGIGHSSVDGGGYPTFITEKWACAACAGKRLLIQHA